MLRCLAECHALRFADRLESPAAPSDRLGYGDGDVALRAIVGLAVALAACGGGSGRDDEATRTPTGASSPAAALEGKTLDGRRISPADYHGKPVYVNVWASW